MDFRTVHRFKGSKGSIRGLAVASDFVACVGLDRYLRVYDHETREAMANVYLKQKLNSVLIDVLSAKQYNLAIHEKRQEVEIEEEQAHQYYCEHYDRKPTKRKRRAEQPSDEKSKMVKIKD
mmetsp:Transcript_12416/g.12456  ORF Transcript_12416/g.12456 Transcript_12416/m.12456 type:complete len:121 (+) Transcript_12416:779-1141(+)